ncbi:Bug family tripartite tricarboxylate transporter substrate binding protein [Paracraurococcus lichenis]|uniref:Tripartite tricarboxylate transporter substrate binding protein n=1 Tax=Paracraurococcus lichenis TaxID=3064888 RepID=A0ABT9DXS8_9PROT|nr:tripartite tricarboxylate transporter substrate binding protein [Paracraurococcus sp. LOR1-02]MDO9708710.1 tripartite tricarboxylate transporter substrate binding protein [Paracraurococcus sp. LOR1-02]
MATTRRAALAAAAALPLARQAAALDFPTRTITWVVPGGPGSVLDVAARLIATKLGPRLSQGVVIDNRLGAGGTAAAEFAARSAPDGHTLFFGNFATFAIAPLLIPNLRYDAQRDFVPVHGIGASANIAVTGMNRPWKTIPELIAYARANPGKVTFGASIGSGQHAATALFIEKAGIELTHIPYNNFGQITNDLVAERVDLYFDYPLSSLPFVRDNRLRALAVNAAERLAVAPEVPTLAEAGLPDAELLGWSGLYVPARTPPAVLARLAAATREALREPEVKALFDSTGTILWDGVDAEQLARALEEEIPRMQRLIGRTIPRKG